MTPTIQRALLVTIIAIAAVVLPGCHPEAPTAAPVGQSTTSALWTCGMHPQVIQDHPGSCPICGMKLTPLRRETNSGDNPERKLLRIDPVVVQNMGVRVAEVTMGPRRSRQRAVGSVIEAEPNQRDINLRVSGWIERLYASTTGMHVRRGEPLFDLYSPELRLAIDQLIAARRAGRQGAGEALYQATRRKLLFLGLSEDQVERFGRGEQAPGVVSFLSPIDGHVVEKPVVTGSAVEAGQLVMRIVDHSRLWLDAQVFEHQLAAIQLGAEVIAEFGAAPGREFRGTVSFIHPHVDPMTRTAAVRITLENDSMQLRPGMYASVQILSTSEQAVLLAPRAAVIDTGTRQIVFVSAGEGRFDRREVQVGAVADDDRVEILTGLAAGDTVVTSGQFLLDSESRLQEAIRKHLDEGLLPGAGDAHSH